MDPSPLPFIDYTTPSIVGGVKINLPTPHSEWAAQQIFIYHALHCHIIMDWLLLRSGDMHTCAAPTMGLWLYEKPRLLLQCEWKGHNTTWKPPVPRLCLHCYDCNCYCYTTVWCVCVCAGMWGRERERITSKMKEMTHKIKRVVLHCWLLEKLKLFYET